MKPRYPLDALQVLREARTDQCAQRLGAAARKASAAVTQHTQAEMELRAARAANRDAERATRERLDRGLVRALDLQQAGECARAGEARVQCLSEAERAARRLASEAERAQTAAQVALAGARSELSALERHRDRWNLARASEACAREEEAALERWNAERFGPGRR